VTPFVLALVVSGVLTGALLPLLPRWGLRDVPNDRSSHTAVTPRGGGIAVMSAILAAVGVAAALGDIATEHASVLLVPAAVLAGVGLVDDVRHLPSVLRLLLQSAVAVGGAISAAVVLGDDGWGLFAFAATATLGLVAYVNAFNFMDGINGISALTGAVGGAWFAWIGADRDVDALVVVGAALAGAALGFLPWNARSRVFLGDVGSYGLGALISAAVVVGWASGVPLGLIVAPLLVYLVDTGWVLVKKVRAGEPLMQAHRSHVYQRLVQLGWPHLAASVWTASLGVACCLVAAITEAHWGPGAAFVSASAVALLHLAAPRLAAYGARFTELIS
jgi:UDP-GlcNAc:undecaprenyl-phosphate GlcNAc-1-phosphate transferase